MKYKWEGSRGEKGEGKGRGKGSEGEKLLRMSYKCTLEIFDIK